MLTKGMHAKAYKVRTMKRCGPCGWEGATREGEMGTRRGSRTEKARKGEQNCDMAGQGASKDRGASAAIGQSDSHTSIAQTQEREK
eukprot:5642882-Pleurochrysis_carterae.AAC.2